MRGPQLGRGEDDGFGRHADAGALPGGLDDGREAIPVAGLGRVVDAPARRGQAGAAEQALDPAFVPAQHQHLRAGAGVAEPQALQGLGHERVAARHPGQLLAGVEDDPVRGVVLAQAASQVCIADGHAGERVALATKGGLHFGDLAQGFVSIVPWPGGVKVVQQEDGGSRLNGRHLSTFHCPAVGGSRTAPTGSPGGATGGSRTAGAGRRAGRRVVHEPPVRVAGRGDGRFTNRRDRAAGRGDGRFTNGPYTAAGRGDGRFTSRPYGPPGEHAARRR